MRSVICTLFEKNYHYGVAALTNSLYRNGFRGSIYAGYRGTLPLWCSNSKESAQFDWPGSSTFEVAEGLQLHFLPLDTNYHLTNYKPDFMLRLLSGPASDAEAIYYFDPDIVIAAPWSIFKVWSECGVALCEDLNSPLPKYHPRRVGWRDYYGKKNVVLNFKEAVYANGGFVGISAKHFDFLNTWRSLQELMAPLIGGLDHAGIKGGVRLSNETRGKFAPFGKTDQDALNATVEAWDGPVSYIGKEGMGFKSGSAIMPHALGRVKPWENKFLKESLLGHIPREVDKKYWKSVSYPIQVYSKNHIFWKKFVLHFSAFIGRFYARN